MREMAVWIFFFIRPANSRLAFIRDCSASILVTMAFCKASMRRLVSMSNISEKKVYRIGNDVSSGFVDVIILSILLARGFLFV